MQLELPRWYDLHTHFRQGNIMPLLIKDHLAMGCTGVLAMPNTKPPVSKIRENDSGDGWSIESYLDMLKQAGGEAFSDIIIPLYLTRNTTTAMIEQGVKSGLLKACKYYPPHGTTGAEQAWHFQSFMDNGIFKALEDNGVTLCVHGEEHELATEDYFARHTNAEEAFYRERMPRLIDTHPQLRIVAEHVTTKVAADFVTTTDNTAATVTPQHLIYTAGHLLKGFRYHLYCLPLVKFEEDREALRKAVTAPDNTKFFAGTDSAPHTQKMTPCGCAAGCYTGGIAPQLYAQAFEMAGCNLDTPGGTAAFEKFLCRNGPAFYGLPVPGETFTLVRQKQNVTILKTPDSDIIPLPVGMAADDAETASLDWSIL